MSTTAEKVLFWGKPEKVRSQAEQEQLTFDGGPPGAYIPNMSRADSRRWRAKLVKGKHPRVEIRKTLDACGTQLLIIVSESGQGFPRGSEKPEHNKGVNVCISMNGAAKMDFSTWTEFSVVVDEARQALSEMVK